jgi:hypothetical protein
MNLNPKNRHAELGSASHKTKTTETLKQVQGDMTEEILKIKDVGIQTPISNDQNDPIIWFGILNLVHSRSPFLFRHLLNFLQKD